jgi:hypothetical protein
LTLSSYSPGTHVVKCPIAAAIAAKLPRNPEVMLG